jgi:hypothetical protein
MKTNISFVKVVHINVQLVELLNFVIFVPQILTETDTLEMLLLTIVTVLMDGSITVLPYVFNVLTDVSLVSLMLLLVPLNQMVVTLTETLLQLVHVILDIMKKTVNVKNVDIHVKPVIMQILALHVKNLREQEIIVNAQTKNTMTEQ